MDGRTDGLIGVYSADTSVLQYWESDKSNQRTIFLYHNLVYNVNVESPTQFENQMKPWVYARRITRSTTYEKATFC